MKQIDEYLNESFRLRDDTQLKKFGMEFINQYCDYLTNLDDEETNENEIKNLYGEFIEEALCYNMEHLEYDGVIDENYIADCVERIEHSRMFKMLNTSFGKTFYRWNVEETGNIEEPNYDDCGKLFEELMRQKSNVRHVVLVFDDALMRLHTFETDRHVIVYLTGDEQEEDAFMYTFIVATK